MSDRTSNVAVYWDFENIQASLVEKRGGRDAYGRTKYQQQDLLIDIDSVMEYAATFGVVSINRAYCNWQWYGKYREPLLRNGLELIQLFHPGASAKNGGDIKLALDCTEDLLRFPHVDIVVIVGGDSDYLPLAQKVKALGKNLVGIGTQANTNRHWARSCHEFKFYEALILDDDQGAPQTSPSGATSPSAQPAPAANAGHGEMHPDNVVMTPPEELLRRAIFRLSGKGGDSWVLKGSIRPMMKRMDPTFDEEQHGARSFGAFIRKFEHLLEVRAGRNDQEIRLRGTGTGDRSSENRNDGGSDRPSREERGRDRDDRGRDRQERRPEAPVDRSPGRVAERIARALERQPDAAGEAATLPVDGQTEESRGDGSRQERFPENRQRGRERGRDRGRDRGNDRGWGRDGRPFQPGSEAPAVTGEEGQIPSGSAPRTEAAAASGDLVPADFVVASAAEATESISFDAVPPAEAVPERRSRERNRGRKAGSPPETSAKGPVAAPAKPSKPEAKSASKPAAPKGRAPAKPKKA